MQDINGKLRILENRSIKQSLVIFVYWHAISDFVETTFRPKIVNIYPLLYST